MTFRDSYGLAKNWKRRVALISLYHNTRLARVPNWKLVNSAKYFGLSIGLVSESLNLSQHWELVKDCESRSEALRKLKEKRNGN